MEIDSMKDSLINDAKKSAIEFLETGYYGGEFFDAMDRLIENEGFIRVSAMILRGDDLKNIIKVFQEEAFAESHCVKEIERQQSIAAQNHADAKRYDEGERNDKCF